MIIRTTQYDLYGNTREYLSHNRYEGCQQPEPDIYHIEYRHH